MLISQRLSCLRVGGSSLGKPKTCSSPSLTLNLLFGDVAIPEAA